MGMGQIKPPGNEPQVLVIGSIYQGANWVPIFDPQPYNHPCLPKDCHPNWGNLSFGKEPAHMGMGQN